MIPIGPPSRRYRLIRVAQLLMVLAVGLLAVASFAGSSTLTTIAWPLRDTFTLAAAGFCVARAILVRGDRLPWAVLGGGLACYGAATVAYSLTEHVRAGQQLAMSPSYADVGWLAFYPACYATVLLLLRHRVLRLPLSVLFDSVIGLLGFAALAGALKEAVEHHDPALSSGQVVVTLVYPLADLLLVLMVVSVFGVLGRRAGRVWWLLGCGLLCFVAADATMASNATGSGGFSPGGPPDTFWALSALMLTFAAWQRQPRAPRVRANGWAVMIVPSVLTLTAIGILVAGATERLPLYTVVLAAATLVTGLGRAGFSILEVQRLAESKEQAHTDHLTHQLNRRGLDERLRAAIAAADTSDHPLALLLLDLDRFKLVNDSLGHRVGDQLLAEVSARIATALRPGDTLARLGGDEFAVLLEGTDSVGAQLVADRVRAALADVFQVDVLTVAVTASIGTAIYPEQAANADELLARADIAMYTAKRHHTGVEHFDPREALDPLLEFTMTESLRVGIGEHQIEAHYQPKVEIATGQVRSVEALARWRHPQRGLLTPASFVPLAEHAGLMSSLTNAVLEQACTQLACWREVGLDVTAAVNISATDLLDAAFPHHVEGVLARHGLGADALELELTETTLMLDRSRAAAVLRQLHDQGVGIALDDYGTGYSTLGYLGGDFPVDVLKLDRSFVSRLECDDVARKIVSSTIDLAHQLGLRVVAEGVETGRALDLLREFGCDLAQGFLIGEPSPAVAITPLLSDVPGRGPAAAHR
ncbi:EAL domain-containing protein [Frankia sp. AgB1.9]|uniref:putative bifunctional diguanylate cyclase/phosphodiesterase n=1 Tax=unclassified Frankia TaxID=2632575 RepID=UPI001933F1E2|nr:MULTISPECIES: EAL domain-containing protein [unclassified Frankia]MBL7490581.1 EAL domain-containing protein [Frankia sp. AgW1.1]MBL7553369.1 EAL domain-containing protein [Frankia sp. AgB1.9]MBL7622248.1 EAL domain-containing protein [Frankia sp. AgB1.8]